MTYLMRNHIRTGEVAGGMELGFHLAEEIQIQINLTITWAIKRSHRRRGGAAGGLNAAVEQDQFWCRILLAAGLENFSPGVFRTAEHGADEIGLLVVRWRRGLRCATGGVTTPGHVAEQLQDLSRVLAEQQADDHDQDDATQSQATATESAHAAASTAGVLFHIVATS